MKRTIALSTAALLGASLLASPVLAQVSVNVDSGVNVGADPGGAAAGADADLNAGATVGAQGEAGTDIILQTEADTNVDADLDDDLDTGTTAAIGGSFDGALSAMGNNSQSAGSISAMTDVSSVNVIRISELEGADMDALATAETQSSASIDELRSSIEANTAVSAALEAQAVDASDVIAADVAADGALTVYVR